MLVELLTVRADLRRRYDIGEIVDVPADEAERLFKSNPPQARPVRRAEAERATQRAPTESAVATYARATAPRNMARR
jgi:hypothetical protein